MSHPSTSNRKSFNAMLKKESKLPAEDFYLESFKSSFPHSVIKDSVVTLKLSEWASDVSHLSAPHTLVYPYILIFDYDNLAVMDEKENVECNSEFKVPQHRYIRGSGKNIKFYGADFVVVQVYIWNFEHIITVYLHRRNKRFKWRATVCDSNFDRNVSDDVFEELRLLGEHVLRKIIKNESKRKIFDEPLKCDVEVHRCLNVNICLPPQVIEKGICYTGICACLIATAIEVANHPESKASTGSELILLILKATSQMRSEAVEFVSGYHSNAPMQYFNQLLLKSKCRERSRSPNWIGRKLPQKISDVRGDD